VNLVAENPGFAPAIIALANGFAVDRIADPEAVPPYLMGEILCRAKARTQHVGRGRETESNRAR
jgi:hypothetical protein